jgi:hypothetical protein
MKKYADALYDLENKDNGTQRRIFNDIKRDLSAIFVLLISFTEMAV